MPVAIALQTDLTLTTASGHRIKVAATSALTFLDTSDLDAAAEIIENIQRGALQANANQFNREELEGGMSSQVTYGPGGEKYAEDQGVPPALESATIEDAADTIIVATFDQEINSPGEDFMLGFSCKVDSVERVINSAAQQVDLAVIHFTLASTVTDGQVVELSYDNGVGDVESPTGGELQSFTDTAVTNNVAA